MSPEATGEGDDVSQLIGQQVGNYVIADRIGKGGMGEVYVAEHPRIGRRVAIKVLGSHIAGQPKIAQRFEAEARVISRLDHPNIVSLFDFGTLGDGSLYYVMELLEGHELEQICRAHGRFTGAEAYPFVLQICRGLQAAHDKGVVHRDLKPQNIFVLDSPTLQVKVLDFGIAKLLEDQQGAGVTTTGMVMGTPLFIAPEQAAGKSHLISPCTDIYSLGVLLFMMLTGELPFSGMTPVLLLAKHIETMPPRIRDRAPEISPVLDDLVNRCLLKDPTQRPKSAAEVALCFAEAVGEQADTALFETGSDITLPPDIALALTEASRSLPQSAMTLGGTTGEVTDAGTRRPRWPLAAAVAALAFTLGVIGVWLATHRAPTPAAPHAAAKPPEPRTSRPAHLPKPAAPGPRREVKVSVAGVPALCTLEPVDGKGGLQKMSSPCRFEARQGQRVRLTVSSTGLHPFLKEWRVDGDLEFAMASDPGTGQLAAVVAQTPPRAAPDAKASSRRSVRHVRRHHVRRLVKQVAPDARVPEPGAKKKPARPVTIGEGTMEVEGL